MKSCSELARPRTANAVVLADMHGKDAAAGTCPNRPVGSSSASVPELEGVHAAQLVAGSGNRPVGYGPPREGRQVAGFDEDKVLATVGAHILERRTELGFSQRDLAALAAVDRAFLARVEQGLRNPSVVLLAKVAQAMDTTVSWLTRDI